MAAKADKLDEDDEVGALDTSGNLGLDPSGVFGVLGGVGG